MTDQAAAHQPRFAEFLSTPADSTARRIAEYVDIPHERPARVPEWATYLVGLLDSQEPADQHVAHCVVRMPMDRVPDFLDQLGSHCARTSRMYTVVTTLQALLHKETEPAA